MISHFTRCLLVASLPLITPSFYSNSLLTLIDLCRFLRSSRLHVRPAMEEKNATREKTKDGAVAAQSNVSWVIDYQLHQLGQSPSRTIARRHFNAYRTAIFAPPCVRAPAFANWSLAQDALKWWSCLVLPHGEDRMTHQLLNFAL